VSDQQKAWGKIVKMLPDKFGDVWGGDGYCSGEKGKRKGHKLGFGWVQKSNWGLG